MRVYCFQLFFCNQQTFFLHSALRVCPETSVTNTSCPTTGSWIQTCADRVPQNLIVSQSTHILFSAKTHAEHKDLTALHP